jgi:oxygen-dependent protoporphyrinogen oxidase
VRLQGGASVLLADKAPTLGGVIETQQKDGAQFEDGPNTFQASAKGMLRLVADLGLEGQVVASNPKLPRFVYSGGELYALPKDLPKLLSPFALVRAAFGVLLPVAKVGDDETVASFIERTLGSEVLTKVVDPFVSTVYTGDPAKMSLKSVFPAIARVAAQSQDAGGLLVGGIKSRLNKSGPAPRDYGELPKVPKGASLSFRQGLRQLPAAAQQRLGDKCVCDWEASSLEVQADGCIVASFNTPSGSTHSEKSSCSGFLQYMQQGTD